MRVVSHYFYSYIHRHTGGLENSYPLICNLRLIHRHTGGLENSALRRLVDYHIHRHTGGLEKLIER